MFRLAHISDVHLGPMPRVKPWQLFNKRITGFLNWKLNRRGAMNHGILDGLIAHIRENQPDHMAITGDLVNLALPAEIHRMRDWLGDLGSPNDISIVLGNHDAYVPGAKKASLNAWEPYALGDNQTKTHFPYLRQRGEISIIGVNTGCATLPFFATGTFSQKQASELETLLTQAGDEGHFRVVMIHHPPFPNATVWAKRLIGDQRFRDVVAQSGAELVLHGHTHIESFEKIDGPDGSVPVIGVPSASHGISDSDADAHHKPAARYNLFDIWKEDHEWHCDFREFGYASQHEGVDLISARRLYPTSLE